MKLAFRKETAVSHPALLFCWQMQLDDDGETAASTGSRQAVVCGNMYAQGAETWLKPSIMNLGRLLKGGKVLGMPSEQFDGNLVKRLIAHIQHNGLPSITTLYLLGLDHASHQQGPQAQRGYLVLHVDRLLGTLWAEIEAQGKTGETLVALFSDHGQIEVIKDDRHSIRIGFPFDQELTPFFTALGLDVHDFPGEAPNCDAVMALNGGSASVYLHNTQGKWADAPEFSNVLRVGRAFWQAHETGELAPDLRNALAAVLVRNVESNGWGAPFNALLPNGEMVPLAHWAAQQENGRFADATNRINNATGKLSGDIWLLSNYADGYYFGKELVGMHGGLHVEDSQATLAFGWPKASPKAWEELKAEMGMAIAERCAKENGRLPNITDLVTGLETAVDWLK